MGSLFFYEATRHLNLFCLVERNPTNIFCKGNKTRPSIEGSLCRQSLRLLQETPFTNSSSLNIYCPIYYGIRCDVYKSHSYKISAVNTTWCSKVEKLVLGEGTRVEKRNFYCGIQKHLSIPTLLGVGFSCGVGRKYIV